MRANMPKDYIKRDTQTKTIFREFSQSGRQILVFGPNSTRKTRLVLDNLSKLKSRYNTNNIWVTMTETTTVESFIADVFFKLHLTRQVQTPATSETHHSAHGSIHVLNWLEKKDKNTQSAVTEQYIGIDDFVILATVLFKQNTVLVVDNMEKLTSSAEDLRTRLAEIAKNMADDAINFEDSHAKIIFIGMANTAEQLWQPVQSLKGRLATISVPSRD